LALAAQHWRITGRLRRRGRAEVGPDGDPLRAGGSGKKQGERSERRCERGRGGRRRVRSSRPDVPAGGCTPISTFPTANRGRARPIQGDGEDGQEHTERATPMRICGDRTRTLRLSPPPLPPPSPSPVPPPSLSSVLSVPPSSGVLPVSPLLFLSRASLDCGMGCARGCAAA